MKLDIMLCRLIAIAVLLITPLFPDAFHTTAYSPARRRSVQQQQLQHHQRTTQTTTLMPTTVPFTAYSQPPSMRQHTVSFLSTSADSLETVNEDTAPSVVDEDDNSKKTPFLSRIVSFYKRGTKMDRTKLTSLGTNVLLAYGFVSNVFGCISVSCSWYIASRKTGLSPLAPGQWKTFGAVYAGFYVALSIMRPLRFVMSMTLSPFWDRAIKHGQEKFKLSKAQSIAAVIFFVNFCGTLSLMMLGVLTASALSGVPIWAK